MQHEKVIKNSVYLKDSLSISIRTYFSIQHIQSAALFARHTYDVEKNYDGIFSEKLFSQHSAYVTAAILSSVFFLEATINELFADTVDTNHGMVDKLTPLTKNLMAQMWKLEVPRTASFNILQKYQIALTLAQKPLFDSGTQPYQDVHLLIGIHRKLALIGNIENLISYQTNACVAYHNKTSQDSPLGVNLLSLSFSERGAFLFSYLRNLILLPRITTSEPCISSKDFEASRLNSVLWTIPSDCGVIRKTIIPECSFGGYFMISVKYPPKEHSGIIVLRITPQSEGIVHNTLLSLLASKSLEEIHGSLVVIRGNKIRFRR